MMARHCSPLTGRFTSVDPANAANLMVPHSLNRYAYVGNNPLIYNDLDGARQNPVTGMRGIDPNPSYGVRGRIRTNSAHPKIGQFGLTRTDSHKNPIPHSGIDINARSGTSVVAAESGTVTITHNALAGNQVQIKTDEGTTLFYSHLDRTASGLSSGSRIEEGIEVGLAGTTGNASYLAKNPDEQHLHFTVKDWTDARIDPVEWLNDPFAPDPAIGSQAPTDNSLCSCTPVNPPLMRDSQFGGF